MAKELQMNPKEIPLTMFVRISIGSKFLSSFVCRLLIFGMFFPGRLARVVPSLGLTGGVCTCDFILRLLGYGGEPSRLDRSHRRDLRANRLNPLFIVLDYVSWMCFLMDFNPLLSPLKRKSAILV